MWHVEVNEFGYRAPRPDRGPAAGQGPNRGLDIYLVDVGDDGLDGYCIGDRPGRHAGVERTASRTKGELLRRHHRKHKRAHAYCVLDDDFAPRQYPTGASGRRALHVTVAHEFFHAIQSAYEATKRDRWLREGTAEWMEDEVFDHANANYDFLPASQLLEPGVPLDAFQAVDDAQDFEYGSWIFWRFLSEYYGTRAVIRQVWQAAAPTGGLNRTALEAVRDVVAGRPPDQSRCRVYCSAGAFPQVFSEFSYWVRNYVQSYEEGPGYSAVLKGARSPGDAEFLFSSQSTTTGPRELALDHLTSGEVTAQVDPGSFQEPSVRVTVDLPIETGPGAIVQATFTNGQVAVYPVQTDGSGRGSLELHGISAVDLILSNSDARLDAEPYRYQIEVLP